MPLSLYWHDYETWGANPRWDRPAQFAGLRTDEALNPIGKPLRLFCYPSDDILPHPEACLITGLSPQRAMREGVPEVEFFRAIHRQLATPGTCGLGYNSLRFDDEFTRYGFYRNFLDPYAREWQNGNSRWDIIDMVRLTHALRPEGIEWPKRPDGVTSFRLEALAEANGIGHESAHDALSDVEATIGLARLIRSRQPRLYDYLFRMRRKQQVGELLDLAHPTPLLHVSSRYPAERGCIALVAPLAKHPFNANGIIVYDLSADPAPLIQLSAEVIRSRLFTPTAELPAGIERIPLKTIHLNKCPVLVPTSTLTPEAAERWGIDLQRGDLHLQQLQAARLEAKIREVHDTPFTDGESDPDGALYQGFFSHGDRQTIARVHATPGEALAQQHFAFEDPRLSEMLFRFRARNYPESLSGEERKRWDAYRRARILHSEQVYGISLQRYRSSLASKMVDPATDDEQRALLSELADWPARIGLSSADSHTTGDRCDDP